MVYIQLDRAKITEKREELEKKAQEILKDDAANQLIISDSTLANSMTFERGVVTLIQHTPVGELAIEYIMSDDEMMQIVRHMTGKAIALKELLSLASRSA